MEPRWYQNEAVDVLYTHIEKELIELEENINPIVAIPTGAGKTLIICMLINKILSDHPKANILVLSHVKEILSQNYNSLTKYFDDYEIGLYSSGLKSKTIKKITVAGIQSAYRNPDSFYDFDIVIIDEAHLVNTKDEGMYRNFIADLEVICIGLTATHFRTNHGYIHEGEDALFNKLVYDLTSFEKFNKLIEDGYLTKLISKKTSLMLNPKGIKTIGNDYSTEQLSNKFDREEITNVACNEIIKYGKNYKKWLIFAIDIEHANHISDKLNKEGIPSIAVHSKIEESADREVLINKFKNGEYRAIVNVNILTTGFDVPSIDLIAMLRPTKSPIIHAQTAGRGLRITDGKDHCLFLDFAGNTERLGPINDIVIANKKDKKSNGKPPSKVCPECGVIHHVSIRKCDVCDYEFIFKEKITSKSSETEIIKTDNSDNVIWLDVDKVSYSINNGKRGKPPSLKVTYHCGLFNSVSEWICYDHNGYPRRKANAWVKYRLKNKDFPKNVTELYEMSNELLTPKSIYVKLGKKYPDILDSKF